MKSKHWLITFFILFFAGIIGFMILNYYADVNEYFVISKKQEMMDIDHCNRAVLSKYTEEHKDTIDAVILGGSKTGVLSVDLLTKYTGKNYYNFNFNHGNFSDYLAFTKYLIEEIEVSEITLHLSSFEVRRYTYADRSDLFKVPARVSGNKWDLLKETLSYLTTDINTTIKELTAPKKTSTLQVLETGQRIWYRVLELIEKDHTAQIEKYVLKNVDSNYKAFFSQKASSYSSFDQNIAALKEIKKLCDDNQVTLKVVIGASFIGERNTYECFRYYDYLRQIVQITDVWDFSDYNAVNFNPYNFYNTNHYTDAVGSLMIRTMYGEASFDGFGIYLTKDNIDSYLEQRISDYYKYKNEFDTTGTIQLFGLDDPSYITDTANNVQISE